MTGGSLGIRVSSYGSLQQQPQNDRLQTQSSFISRKPSRMSLGGSREKERVLPLICRYLGRSQVGMFVLFVFALLAFISGYSSVNRDAAQSATSNIVQHNQFMFPYVNVASDESISTFFPSKEDKLENISFSSLNNLTGNGADVAHRSSSFPPIHVSGHAPAAASHAVWATPSSHPCDEFAFPPPPPVVRRRIGPRPCPVCYLPVDQAIASMPSFPSQPTVLRKLEFIHEENPIRSEPHAGSEFGGYPSLKQRNNSFDIAESMTVHCGFVKGSKPGRQTGFDIDEANLIELEQPHDVIVASAIFGNYDLIQQPKNISEIARQKVPFYMFIDEETEAYMRNSSSLDSSMRVGLWRVIVVHNVPYLDARRNGKVPKLLLHRLFPNVRYSIWIDGKLELVVDPYQILERFLWRHNATFAISRHYRRFDVFEEAEANKAAGKYDNSSIDSQIEFYKTEGLTPYSEAKLPITSDVPEGCVIIKEHIPITNLFTCLWFNEVDRFTARDQLSFSTVRDKIMSKVNWTANMFLDCERRNFVIQAYHKDILEHISPPVAVTRRPRPPSRSTNDRKAGSNQAKKNLAKRARGERRASSRRHRKVAIGAGSRDNTSF